NAIESLSRLQRSVRGGVQVLRTVPAREDRGDAESRGHADGEPGPAEWRKKILHARLVVGDAVLMGGDMPPERYESPKGFSVTIGVTEPTEAERIFKALSENGTVTMSLQQTFWAVRFGMLVDRFGIPWMVNCEGPR